MNQSQDDIPNRKIIIFRIIFPVIMICLFFNSFAIASGPDPKTTQLIKHLGLKESKQPVNEMSHWRKPTRIVMLMDNRLRQSKPNAPEWLQQVVGNIEFEVAESRSELDFLLDDADVLLGYCSEEILESGQDLRYILNYSAGVDKCVKSDLIKDGDFLLTNMQRIYGPGIAEHVIGMMYMLTRKLHVFHANQLKNLWNRRAVKRTDMWEVQGRTMLIVGLGGIGTEIARRAQALGMRVIATRNSSRKGPDFVEYVGLAHELPELVKQADIIVNSTPLTPSTRGLFDSNLFKQMQSGAYFINIGRGKSVVTEDLIQALNSGHLGGAALDVQDPEPLPSDHPLWKAKNIIITPHISASSTEQMARFWLLVRENLRRYINGERMLNVVNIKRGY